MSRRPRIFSLPQCEPDLARSDRKQRGIYYTPPEIVRLIVDLTLSPLAAGALPRVLDPACGAGEFLLEASRQIRQRHGSKAAGQSVVGVDIDEVATEAARSRLKAENRGFNSENILNGDGLNSKWLTPASFDCVIGNPPYVNIRQLAKGLEREKINQLRQRFRTAHGNFDLYVLFIERAIELLRPGGRCGLIVPNKWATLDYAQPCRELLLEQTTIEHVIDFTDSRAFAKTSVYPHVLVFRKESPPAGHVLTFRDFQGNQPRQIEQSSLKATAFQLGCELDVESRAATVPLGEVAKLGCGTAGYSATKIARRLLEGGKTAPPRGEGSADFITSGNIDRYAIRLGDVRYLNHDYLRPRLPLDIPELTAAKRQLFAQPKIVIAGMSQRLEAAWDAQGLALGVQVFAASEFQVDPFYLLSLLNSKLLSYLFATRFAAKRLGGGYLAINKGQLTRLPIRIINSQVSTDQRLHNRLAKLASSAPPSSDEAQIDQLVYQLYRLSSDEIARVERLFVQPASRAA